MVDHSGNASTQATSEFPQIPGYEVERKLGAGGMADVYLAVQHGFDRRVALKLISAAATDQLESKERFYREARNIGALHHPGITPVYEFGEHDGQVFLSMQYLPHGDLEGRLARGGMDPVTALGFTRQLADALGYAHQHGVVHRDIKPANVLFASEERVMLADFGIARQLNQASGLTRGFIIGSPPYMSPEQMSGEKIDPRTDHYSLGVMLYEMLTGVRAFPQSTTEAMFAAKMSTDRLELPRHLRRYQPLLDRMTAKRREDRYESAESIVSDIDTLLGNQQTGDKNHWSYAFAVVVLLAAVGLAFTTYRLFSPEPLGKTVGNAVSVTPTDAELYLRPQLVRIDESTRLAEGAHQVLAWAPGYLSQTLTINLPTDASTGVTLEPVVEPGVAEFHRFQDFLATGDDQAGRVFLDSYPRSPMAPSVLATLGSDDLDIDSLAARAEIGDVVAQVGYSELLDQGWAVTKDPDRAMALAKRAADRGYAFGAYQYALQLLQRGERTEEAIERLEQAAEKGLFLAENLLGRLLVEGKWVTADVTRGLELVGRAADAGFREALFNQALAFQEGRVVPGDEERAQRLFAEAARLGLTEAEAFLR